MQIMANKLQQKQGKNFWVWAFLFGVLALLYLPLLPPIIQSFTVGAAEGEGLFHNYRAIADNTILVEGIRNTLLLGLITAIVTPILALAVAQAVRAWKIQRLLLGLVLIPLFIPGISTGVATALFFRLLGVDPSLWTMAAVHIIWALPFATLLLLTIMAGFDKTYIEAAYMLGTPPVRAFFEIELPQIYQGLLGASIFSLILSFNETIRTSLVQGRNNTVQTYIWSQFQQVGLSGAMYALMTALILLTLVLIGALVWLDRKNV